jgi:hypothetical protein
MSLNSGTPLKITLTDIDSDDGKALVARLSAATSSPSPSAAPPPPHRSSARYLSLSRGRGSLSNPTPSSAPFSSNPTPQDIFDRFGLGGGVRQSIFAVEGLTSCYAIEEYVKQSHAQRSESKDSSMLKEFSFSKA